MESGWNSERLLAEMDWVRRLARALVRDAADADDLAQDAYIVAAEHQPSGDRPLRPWLARVLHKLAFTRRRGERRRDAREAASELGREVPSPEQLVERVELQRAVAGEVLALAEPYRTTVLLHFVEGLSSAEIARRLDLPDGTVRRRLKTAIDQLRLALTRRENGPKRGWLAALIPLGKLPDSHAAPAAVGALVMKKLIAIAVAVLLLVVLGVKLWRGQHATADGPAPAGAHAAGAARQLSPVPAWLTQPEVGARRIAGRVVAGDAPVSGAIVRLGLQVADDMQIGNPLLQPVAEVTTGSDGTFDFGAQPAATFSVSASAAERPAVSIAVANADPRVKSDQLILELGECHAKLFGTVFDASGGVVAKARVTTAGLSGTETDAGGRYALCLAPGDNPGTPLALVRVGADGYGTVAQQVIVAGALPQNFVLVPEAVIVGRVFTASGEPVVGARVIARPDVIELPHHVTSSWAESDREGRFRIAGLQPGKFQLTASAPRLASAAPLPAIAHAAKDSRELRLVLGASARVRGHVVMNGEPVAGVTVAIVRAGQPPSTPSVSQADGSFVLDGVAFGTVGFFAMPYSVRSPDHVEIARANVDGITLEVGKLATLLGRVTRKGRPVAGANVLCFAPRQFEREGKTDASGEFVLDGLPAGDAHYQAWDLHEKAWALTKPVHLVTGEAATVDIELDSAGEVKGTVVDESGQVVPGVYVRMDITDGGDDMCESIADAHGEFDCPILLGGVYLPTVSPAPGVRHGFAPATGSRFDPITVPHDGPVTGVRLAIKHELLAIRGSVVDDLGAPVPDVHVEAISMGPSSMDFLSAMSDASGHFEIGSLARGTYTVHAHAADGSETQLPGIAAGGDAVTIKLARPGAIEGTLVGFSLPPVVQATTITAGLQLGSPAAVDGTAFSVNGLPPGHYTITATAGPETDGTTVDVRSGETAHVTLKSRGSGRVEGHVMELASMKPLAGMHCESNLSMGGQMDPGLASDPSRGATSDAAGHFAMAAPLGRVRVFCVPPPAVDATSVAGTDVDVTVGAVANVDVFAVRPKFGATPGDPGFAIQLFVLPLTVAQVAPGSAAAAAGVLPGDHVVTIDGATLQGVLPQPASFLPWNHEPGSTVAVGLERGGVTRTVKIAITAGR